MQLYFFLKLTLKQITFFLKSYTFVLKKNVSKTFLNSITKPASIYRKLDIFFIVHYEF